MELSSGQMIGARYRVEQAIGQGGMAMVYRAEDLVTGQAVAIKLLRPEVVAADPQIVARFDREGEALRRLNHPNIVTVLETLVEGDDHFVVMEYVGGGDLRALLERSREQGADLPVARVLEIALDLSDALARAHRLRIIHRDLKPANVLLAEDGTPRLTDFGVAHFSDATQVTQTGQIVGTLAYISPEVVLGDKPDARGDLWAFGVLLYELLTLRRPFDEATTAGLLNAIVNRPPTSLRDLRPDAPPALVTLVEQLLVKDRDQRIDSARRVGAILEAILAGKEVPPETDDTPASLTPPPLSSVQASTASQLPTAARPEDLEGIAVTAPLPPAHISPSVDTGERIPDWTTYPEDVLGQRRQHGTAADRQRARRRRRGPVLTAVVLGVALIGIVLTALLNTSQRQFAPVEPVAAGQVMVLVTRFDGDAEAGTAAGRLIADDLRQRLEENAFSNLVIRETSSVAASDEEARAAAEQLGAGVVVWGRQAGGESRVRVLPGSLAAVAPDPLHIPPETLTEITGFTMTVTDPRGQSIVPAVVGTLALTYTAFGDMYEIARVVTLLDESGTYAAPEFVETNVPGRVLGAYYNYVNHPAAALDAVDAALEGASRNPLLYLLRSATRHRTAQIDLALEDMRTAQRFNYTEWAAPAAAQGQHFLLYPQDYAAASDAYREAVRLRPDDWFLRSLSGAAAYLIGDYDLAQAELDAARMLDPEASFPYVFAVPLALREGRLVEAVAMLNEVFTRFPDPTLSDRLIESFYGVEDNLLAQGFSVFGSATLAQWRQVIVTSDAILAADRAWMDRYMADMYLLRGLAFCNVDDLPAAEEAYSALIDLHPDYIFAYAMRAEARRLLGELPGALADTAVLASSDQADLYAALAPALASGEITCKNLFSVDLSAYVSP